MDKRVPQAVPSLEELKRMIKQETMSSGRLQSLRLPRDLSLGGTKPKKVYTPNLNVVRNKDKNKPTPPKTDRSQKRQQGNSSRGRKRAAETSLSRDKNRQSRFIQSEGIFSQGMGELKVSSRHSERSSEGGRAQTATLAVPKITKGNWNVNKNKEAILVRELMDDGSDSDSDVEYDPVILPLDRNRNTFVDAYKVKLEDVNDMIKKEDPDGATAPTATPPLSNGCGSIPDIKPKIKIEKTDEPTTETYNAFTDSTQTFDEDNPAFSLIRLPDSFLGKTWKENPTDREVDYTMQHMPEGHVGKILVRKSGKMEMVVKNTKYTLNTEDTEGLTENAVLFPGEQSIALEPSVVTLGTVNEKFALTPEWNSLFDRARKKKFYW